MRVLVEVIRVNICNEYLRFSKISGVGFIWYLSHLLDIILYLFAGKITNDRETSLNYLNSKKFITAQMPDQLKSYNNKKLSHLSFFFEFIASSPKYKRTILSGVKAMIHHWDCVDSRMFGNIRHLPKMATVLFWINYVLPLQVSMLTLLARSQESGPWSTKYYVQHIAYPPFCERYGYLRSVRQVFSWRLNILITVDYS